MSFSAASNKNGLWLNQERTKEQTTAYYYNTMVCKTLSRPHRKNLFGGTED